MGAFAPGSAQVPSRRVLLGALGLWLLAVTLATLTPVRGGPPLPEGLCLLCGENGAADALRNLALFSPLGLLLAGLPGPRWRAPLAAVAISAALEGLQGLIPGRHPSLGDVAFNGLGALAGAFAPRLLVLTAWGPPSTRRALGAAAAASAAGAILLTAVLAGPASGRGRLHVRLRPEFGHLAMLPGRVVSARAGARVVRDTVLPGRSDLARDLRGPAPLAVAFTLEGPLETGRDTGLLRTHDDPGHEIVFMGLRGRHLVYRERTIAGVLRMEVPTHALAAPSLLPGTGALTARVERGRRGVCLALEGADTAASCGLGLTPGSGWRYVAEVPRAPGPVRAGLQLVWVAALMVPFGVSGPSRHARAAGLVGVWVAMLLAAASGALLAPTPGDILAVPAGLWAGLALRPALPRRIE